MKSSWEQTVEKLLEFYVRELGQEFVDKNKSELLYFIRGYGRVRYNRKLKEEKEEK